jgi:hypothetical protein
MATIRRADVLGPSRYEPIRDEMRRRVIALKKPRRVLLGDLVSIVFESRDTMLFQIEEMLRAEKITDEAGIQAEIDVYAPMVPTRNELPATLFIELAADADAKVELKRLVGLDEHVALHVGPHVVKAWFEPGRQEDDRIAAVQFIRFRVDDAARDALRTPGTPLRMTIDHPAYLAEAALGEDTRAALARDLD